MAWDVRFTESTVALDMQHPPPSSNSITQLRLPVDVVAVDVVATEVVIASSLSSVTVVEVVVRVVDVLVTVIVPV